MRNILFCVSSDVTTDQRVLRHCALLVEQGFRVHVVARKKTGSPDLPELPFSVTRFSMFFQSGPLFYLFFNFRLFFFLLFRSSSVIWSNDIDTLVPCALVSKLKKKKLVFDAHELFTEVPELEGASAKKKIWLYVERIFTPKADMLITVNQSLARQFYQRYGLKYNVIRNVPLTINLEKKTTKTSVGIPDDALLCVLQGSGLNKGRGLIETLQALPMVPNVHLMVIGSGDALEEAKTCCQSLDLDRRVHFIPRIPYAEMMSYTQIADIGLAYDTHACLNFQLALPNKIFDYFQAGIAVLCGPQPEIKHLVDQYACGRAMDFVNPEEIAQQLAYFSSHREELEEYKRRSRQAAHTETWDNEKTKLIELLKTI
jgi:glycosyltransferase involved in cell wall biosynthesis